MRATMGNCMQLFCFVQNCTKLREVLWNCAEITSKYHLHWKPRRLSVFFEFEVTTHWPIHLELYKLWEDVKVKMEVKFFFHPQFFFCSLKTSFLVSISYLKGTLSSLWDDLFLCKEVHKQYTIYFLKNGSWNSYIKRENSALSTEQRLL